MSLNKKMDTKNKAKKILSSLKTAKVNLKVAANRKANLHLHLRHPHHKDRNQANKTHRTHKNSKRAMIKLSKIKKTRVLKSH
jgi:hypothetical protein